MYEGWIRTECGGRKDTDGIIWVGKSKLVVFIKRDAYCRFGGALGLDSSPSSSHQLFCQVKDRWRDKDRVFT